MNFLNAITVGLKEIRANKFRSCLTMLGIILGVGSLVAQSALVKGLENGMKETLIAIGGVQKVYITAQEIPVWQKHRAGESVGITMNDVYALQRSAPLIRLITPEMRIQNNTMWLRFRAGAGQDGTSDPRLSSLEFMVIDMDQMNNALQQVKNVLMHTHKGIEDFSFNTNENWFESVVIAIIGGVAGLLASKGLVNVLALLSPGDDTPVITVNAMLLGFGFSVCVGVLAGLIPAFKAARLHPIQAQRYE